MEVTKLDTDKFWGLKFGNKPGASEFIMNTDKYDDQRRTCLLLHLFNEHGYPEACQDNRLKSESETIYERCEEKIEMSDC